MLIWQNLIHHEYQSGTSSGLDRLHAQMQYIRQSLAHGRLTNTIRRFYMSRAKFCVKIWNKLVQTTGLNIWLIKLYQTQRLRGLLLHAIEMAQPLHYIATIKDKDTYSSKKLSLMTDGFGWVQLLNNGDFFRFIPPILPLKSDRIKLQTRGPS